MHRRPLFRIRTLLAYLLVLALVASFTFSLPGSPVQAAPAVPVTFTILHTNDFHGQLEASGSNPGLARVAAVVNGVRTAVGADNVLLVDAGDEMQGSLLSNLNHGVPTIAAFNALGYDAATFGNHEFDWGQPVLGTRVAEAVYPYISANIVVNNTGNCATAGWSKPGFVDAPYEIKTVGTAPNLVNVALIGVTTTEVPTITTAAATAGICFMDPADSILHYYDAMKAQADVIVVLSHIGFEDGGYGYGIPVYGDKTLAAKLNTAGKPANLIIGGHSHTNLAAATMVGNTAVVQAYYNGRNVGRADVTVETTGAVSVEWLRITGFAAGAKDPAIDTLVTSFASDPAYQALINTPVGYSQVDLLRDYNGDNMMGDFIDDSIYNYLNTDSELNNDVDIFLNNAGGIRTDWCWNGTTWVNTGCVLGEHAPALLTYGNMFTVLPFGNATVVGDMTGAQILEVLNQSATLFKGALQPAGLRYSFYRYSDAPPPTQPYAWGAYDVCVKNKVSGVCEPLEMDRTYRVGTNEFLAPAGGDGFNGFKYMTNITYWGDMLNAVNAFVAANYGTPATAYLGPNGDGFLDGRIIRDGTDAGGSIVPITILHHNDSHGNLAKGTYVGYTQLATLINQEKAHNPTRTLLLNAGDQIQGDAMMYYFKDSYSGFAVDSTPLPAALQTNPMMAVMNAMNYDAMTLGNHEFNFGNTDFAGVLGQAQFPILGANVTDDGSYGLAAANGGQGVKPYIEKDLAGIKVAVLGITNHRVPNYELPSNITGLSFSDPLAKAQELSDTLRSSNDVLIALTHIGFTTNPNSVEVDNNVDTNMAAGVSGLDAIIGGHSHTNPANPETPYEFLPAIVGGPSNTPVIINQAYRYNNTLGEVVIGVRPDGVGGYEVASRAGRYLSVTMDTAEDAAIKAIVDPYVAPLNAYNNTVIGQTTVPLDALQAYTQETNAANLQADASVFELAKNGITDVDFHLSGAMANRKIAASATAATPVSLKVSDVFTLMPYENSLVVLSMNGPQLKAVLERAYRNYYYYKYVPGYGGYSYYTTCNLDIDAGNHIYYDDTSPSLPDGNNVLGLEINGEFVDFADASTYYEVSTVNYLAAGSCNFNDSGVSLFPLNQIVHDTQYYVRDAVIDYVKAMGTISPAIEGRIAFVLPSINMEKSTSGFDVAAAPGPEILVGSLVTWEYVVTNTGNVALTDIAVSDDQGVSVTCPEDTLARDESMTCSASGTATTGQYSNTGTVTAKFGDIPVTDSDSSYYFGADPSISIEKTTSDAYGNTGDGVGVIPGDEVTWTYRVTNNGNVGLSNVTVTDSQEDTVGCPKDILAAGESMTCTASGIAGVGWYHNNGTAGGDYSDDVGHSTTVTDSDDSSYFGLDAGYLTNASLSEFGEEFNLVFTPDIQNWPGYYKLSSSNPGQFSYNLFYLAEDSELDIEIPFPFVTQGTVPVHVYSGVFVAENGDGSLHFTPGDEDMSFSSQVTFENRTLHLEGLPDGGFVFVAIHLDFGLKKTSGWTKGRNDNALHDPLFSPDYPKILNGTEYIFSSDIAGSEDSIQNANSFKNLKGFGGTVLDGSGVGIQGEQVELRLAGNSLETATTDANGWYWFDYIHKGKTATYKLVYGTSEVSVTVGGNVKYGIGDFVGTP